MKKNKIFIAAFLVLGIIILIGCKKIETGDVSKITYFAELELVGNQFMVIPQGTPFTDPGVNATVQGQPVTVDVSGDIVDENTPGVYRIEYSVTNAEGFEASTFRLVGVISPTAAAQDLSGKYFRTKYGSSTTGGDTAYWTKMDDGLYIDDNLGGVTRTLYDGAYVYDVYVFNTDQTVLEVPSQPSALGGNVTCYNVTLVPDSLYSWQIQGSGYGTNLRTFEKQ
ncbi:immunoglobulin-like domain-containing protein [Bacteroidota bacterium]